SAEHQRFAPGRADRGCSGASDARDSGVAPSRGKSGHRALLPGLPEEGPKAAAVRSNAGSLPLIAPARCTPDTTLQPLPGRLPTTRRPMLVENPKNPDPVSTKVLLIPSEPRRCVGHRPADFVVDNWRASCATV